MTSEPEPRLWEIDHPYGGAEGDSESFESFEEFLTDCAPFIDPGYDHLYRWDWRKPGLYGWEGEEQLELFFVLQRKSRCMSYTVPVTEADEAAVRTYLAEMAAHVVGLWAPLLA